MAGAGNSKTPDMAEAFMEAALENRKAYIEEEVFQKVLQLWEDLQGLQLLYECGEANTPRLLAKLEKYRERLNVFETCNLFEDGYVYELMPYKERETLKSIADTDSFARLLLEK